MSGIIGVVTTFRCVVGLPATLTFEGVGGDDDGRSRTITLTRAEGEALEEILAGFIDCRMGRR